jgi:hypothetical protein
LDRARLEGRVRAHLNGLVHDQATGYMDLFGGWRGVMGQIRDAFTHIGWTAPMTPTQWGAGLEDTIIGPEPPYAPSEEREVELPDAPEYQTSFTHPGKTAPGFTSDFAPLARIDLESDEEYDPLFDEDPPPRKNKGKGKAVAPQILRTVCAVCKDPLVMGSTTEDRRTYALRCGHVLDGKCLWKLAKPLDSHESESMEAERTFEFTFTAPTTTEEGAYHEDNDPEPMRRPENTNPSREIVPVPDRSRRRRQHHQQSSLDDIDDQPVPGPSTAPQLDLSDPFFPTLRDPTQPATSSNRKKGRRKGKNNDSKFKSRKVPKSRGRLREELFEWNCPVPECGRQHLSVRLVMEGAKWKCDPEKGALVMFV